MVYPGVEFNSFGSLNKGVPVLICSGMSKRNWAPGWRTGWLVLTGPEGVFEGVRQGVERLMSILMGSNTICQHFIPKIPDGHKDVKN